MSSIPEPVLREATLVMADWLERRQFGVTMLPGMSRRDAEIATLAWTEGYRRAIHELRWAAQPPVVVPDDIRELEP